MKHVFYLLAFSLLALTFNSCDDDEGKKPDIEFKTGAGYTSSDATIAGGSIVTVGIHAEKTEDEDVLKHFNVSLSINGLPDTTVYDEDILQADEDVYDYDFHYPVPVGPGVTYKLTFTVTNRDGLTNQVALTITAS